jgi:hypothetical protein
MKKFLIVPCSVFIFVFLFSISTAEATVGGPTYIYNLKYNPADTSVYYTSISESGRGCPPVLHKISLTTFKNSTVLSCDQGEKLTDQELAAELAGITAGFKDLTQINLANNDIGIMLERDREESWSDGSDLLLKIHFLASIYQDQKLIAKLPITGCSDNQPFYFAGYAVPGLNKKMIFLVSTPQGDCWEGGYTMETLHPTNGTIKDRGATASPQKTKGPLVPGDGTLTISYESAPRPDTDEVTPTSRPSPSPESPAKSQDDRATIALIAGAFLLIGVALGFFAKR